MQNQGGCWWLAQAQACVKWLKAQELKSSRSACLHDLVLLSARTSDTTESICKAGFARDDASHAVSLPIFVRPEKPDIVDDKDLQECYVDDEAQNKRGVLTLKHPIEPVLYQDLLERMMQNHFAKEDDRHFPESMMEPEGTYSRLRSTIKYVKVSMQAEVVLRQTWQGRVTQYLFVASEEMMPHIALDYDNKLVCICDVPPLRAGSSCTCLVSLCVPFFLCLFMAHSPCNTVSRGA